MCHPVDESNLKCLLDPLRLVISNKYHYPIITEVNDLMNDVIEAGYRSADGRPVRQGRVHCGGDRRHAEGARRVRRQGHARIQKGNQSSGLSTITDLVDYTQYFL